MRRRTHTSLVVPMSLFCALALFLADCDFAASAQAPAPPEFKRKEVKLLKDKEISEKRGEKNKAKALKERPDMAPIEEYYRDYLIPQLTQPSPESINPARKEFLEDLEAIEKNKELSVKFNPYFVKEMREVAIKGADGKVYCPSSRINAMVLLARVNTEPGKPYPAVQQVLLEAIKQTENDGVTSSAMFTLLRHLKAPGTVGDIGRLRFAENLQVILTTPAPLSRSPESHFFLLEQVIDCLTEIAKTDLEKDASKLAVATLTPALVKIIDEQKSEWLVETALHSFGSIKHASLTPEDATKLEKAIAKYTRQSLKDWRKRISNSGGLVAGGMAGGMGSLGMGSGGMGSGGGKGGSSDGGEGMMGSGGGSGGSSGGGPAAGRTRRPFEDQPKEVKNARRIAHQRFERIHMALDGFPINSTVFLKRMTPQPPAGAKVEAKGLLASIPADEKDKVVSLITNVEAFQKELNDEKVTDLTTLTAAVAKSLKLVRADCDLILGETKVVVITDDDEPLTGAGK